MNLNEDRQGTAGRSDVIEYTITKNEFFEK